MNFNLHKKLALVKNTSKRKKVLDFYYVSPILSKDYRTRAKFEFEFE